VGEFYQELQELPPEDRRKYKGFEGMQDLMDRMIERLLVLEDTYDQMLDTKTKDEVEHVREDVLKQILHQEEVDDKLEISDEEMKSFYSEHKERFVEPPQAKISYIQIGRGQTKDEYDRGEKKAREAYEKLNPGFWKKGQPFEEVAREFSEDPETAPKGGEMDAWISESNNLYEEIASHTFHENVLNLPAGEIGPPFYFQGSWYIVKVRERKKPRPFSFEEAKAHIREELTANKHEELTRKMGRTLLEKSDLVIYDDVIESMLDEKG
jgi:parvulin-like peptidyl-prolyl isomerase